MISACLTHFNHKNGHTGCWKALTSPKAQHSQRLTPSTRAQASRLQMGTRTRLSPKCKGLMRRIQAASPQQHCYHPEKFLWKNSYCLKFQSKGEGKRKGRRLEEGKGGKASMKEREGKFVIWYLFWFSKSASGIRYLLKTIKKWEIIQTNFVYASFMTNTLFNCMYPSHFISVGNKAFGIYFWNTIVSITMAIFVSNVCWVS